MNPVDFLKKELGILARKFPNIYLRYGYNDIINTYIVELLPLSEYLNNKALDESWIPVSVRFNEVFKNDDISIAFISSDSSLSVTEIIADYNNPVYTNDDSINQIFNRLTERINGYSFPVNMPDGLFLNQDIMKFLKLPVENIESNEAFDDAYLNAA